MTLELKSLCASNPRVDSEVVEGVARLQANLPDSNSVAAGANYGITGPFEHSSWIAARRGSAVPPPRSSSRIGSAPDIER
jgi:hypothetical protein